MKPSSSAFRACVALGLCLGIVLALPSCGGSSSSTPTPSSPQFSTFQAASVVIGQSVFTTGSTGTSATTLLHGPFGNPGVGSLYLSDYYNNRVLGYNTVPTSNGAAADFVLGQPDFTSSSAGTSATAMTGPQTAIVHDGKLLVLEYDNRRILIWNTKPSTTNAPADVVIGQANMTSSSGTCNDTNLADPESFAIVNGALVVADSTHHRVLIWNTIPTSSGTPADKVIGQADFTQCGANTGGRTASTFSYPTDIASIGGKLLVADFNNNRVLVWNSMPTCTPSPCAITTPADMVLGQADFASATANSGGLSGASLYNPYYLATDGTRLAVADRNNFRVLIWNSVPTCTPTAPASNCAITTSANVVLGQPNFTSNVRNNDGSGTSATPTDKNICDPTGLTFTTNNQLIAMDACNSRALIFNAH